MVTKKNILLIIGGIVLFSCSTSRTSTGKTTGQPVQQMAETTANAKTDTAKKIIRPYKEIITDKAVTQNGLFKVHKVGERYYFEVSDSLLNKDILIVNRVSKAAAGFKSFYGFGYGGDYIGENVVKFVKGPNDNLFIQRTSYLDISRDSSQNGMYRSVLNSSLPTIVASINIKAFSPDSTGMVVDMTDYFSGDNDIFFFSQSGKKQFSLGSLQADKSYIQSISSFPLNTEIKTVKTYAGNGDQALTYELNSSIVLLPVIPMKPRYIDERVGYFSREYRDFDAPQGVEVNAMITRWRLEPKNEDLIKYKTGELVVPKKPIIFYIDPATPKKWVPYLIKGVNAWQKAFEKAGFKNAIYALEAPVDDPAWSLEDARHSAIIYKASDIQNASGPQISDPRSGEILESHINWYHNIQQLLHDWYFIQAAASDPKARMMQFDDSLMGRLIQYVCTHEVGHTLGLMHNFRASSAVPVDSLRSRQYLALNGHTPSIMDYARFNYVAQPEDSIPEEDLIPRIGAYDEWAIEWGYRLFPALTTKDEENIFLKQWIVQRQSRDKRLFFGTGPDVRDEAEDLGDDAMKASYYGIKNLKFVMAHLTEWARTANKDYSDLKRLNRAVFNQYASYMTHVLKYVGGEYRNLKTGDQRGPEWTFVDKEKQRSAIQFLQTYLFDTPDWLFNKQVFSLSGSENVIKIFRFQEFQLSMLMHPSVTYNLLFFNETNQSPGDAYHFDELLTDLESGIWKELNDHANIDLNRRQLQKTYAFELTHNGIRIGMLGDFIRTDYCTIINNHMKILCNKIRIALPGYKELMSKTHLEDILVRLQQALDFQKKNFPEFPGPQANVLIPGPKSTLLPDNIDLSDHDSFLHTKKQNMRGCWDDQDFLKTFVR